MENSIKGEGVVIVKEDLLMACQLHSIIPRSLRCLLSEIAISQLRLTPGFARDIEIQEALNAAFLTRLVISTFGRNIYNSV